MRLTVPRSPLIRLLLLLILPLLLTLTLQYPGNKVLAGHPALSLDNRGTATDPVRSSPALDNGTNNVIVAIAPLTRTTPIELVALTLDVNLTESDGHTIALGNTTFKLHNTDVTNPFSATIGFPEWAGGSLSFDPGQFSQFQVTYDNKKLPLDTTPAPVKIGTESRNINWYSFTLELDPDEKKVVRVDFSEDLGTGVFPRFTYGLLPSNSWKGPITSARLQVHFAAPTTGEQFIALDPTLPDFDGQNLTWLWTDFEPSANPGVTLIRPSLWNEIVNRRSFITANPNDASQHAALARLYQTLASEDSPRRDNFMSEAVAEMETAARLDPKNVDAVSSLAQVYETRAGPAAGPRDASYVALALGAWKNLVGTRLDADARKHAAEDSFYLAIAARSNGQNKEAVQYLTDAANFAPQGAGPLYTREHWQSEAQAAHVALARAALQQEDLDGALAEARAAFGNGFSLDPSLPTPAFALDRASVKTSDGERQISLHLLAYPAPSDQAKQAVQLVVTALNKARAGTAALDASNGEYTLNLKVPFGADKDLVNRLHLLAKAFPEREDWDAVRSVVDSSGIELGESESTLTRAVHYREDVDLEAGSASLRALLNKQSGVIGQLEQAAAKDDASQLRLELLKQNERWWQNALAAAVVRYEIETPSIPARAWSVNLGSQTSLTYDNEGTRTEVYIVGAIAAAALVLLLLLFLLLMRFVLRRGRARTAT